MESHEPKRTISCGQQAGVVTSPIANVVDEYKVWRKVFNTRVGFKVGDGSDVRFRYEKMVLYVVYPQVFRVVSYKESSI